MTDLAAAAGKMHIVTQRMVAKYPFHANIIAAGVFVAEPVKTMAVTIREGLLTFLYDPAFVLANELDLLIGGLLHEVGHVLADHLSADPAAYPDRRARTIAEEVSVNEWIAEPLPPGVLRIDQFNLPPDEDTAERYRRLRSKKHRSGRNAKRPGRKSASMNRKKASQRRNASKVGASTFDDHSVWEEPQKQPEQTRDVIDRAVLQAADRLTDADRASMSESERQRVQDARGRLGPPAGVTEVIASATARIRWEPLLAQYVGRRREAVATFRRPSRRFPTLVGIVPSYVYKTARLLVLAVIDTSGSMDAHTLAVISAEIEALALLHDVVVVQCDDRIRTVQRFTGRLTEIVGRAGTDFRPPLARDFLAAQRADVVVYFCDGEGIAPSEPPPVAVIWAITAGGRRPAAWGHAVRLPTKA